MSALTWQDIEDLHSEGNLHDAVQRIVDRHTANLEARLATHEQAIRILKQDWNNARSRADAAEAKLAAINALHFTNKGGLFCVTCGNYFPCPTSRIIHDNPREET